MSHFRTFAAALAVILSASIAIAQDATPVGLWLTEDGKSRVRIERCGAHLCGTVIWLREPNEADGSPKRDDENPNPELRDRPILGLRILYGFEQASADGREWDDGSIYNPEDGKTYRCNLTLREDGTLRVRGYVGISLLGKTQIWQPVAEEGGE